MSLQHRRPAYGAGTVTGLGLVIALSAGMAFPAAAQERPQERGQRASSFSLEEILVTARQREESLQTVPVAVSALDAAFIEQSFTQEVREIEKYMPNVELGRMQFAGGALTASIRGVSFADLERSFEPAVGVSVDGVFLGSNTGAMIDMFDIESIEVLRGPQGTLFGRNTIGGTINVRRSRPTGEWGIKASATIGSYGRNDYKVIANAPVVEDVLALKLGAYSMNGDSHTRHYLTGKREDGPDKLILMGSLLFTPTDRFEAQLSVDYIDDDSTYPNLINLSLPGQAFCDGFGGCADTSWFVARDRGFKVAFTEKPFKATIESVNVNFRMKYDLGSIAIESITGYIDSEDSLSQENTGTPDIGGLPLFVADRDQTSEQFSQELRAVSSYDGWFNFVAGLYYFKSEYDLSAQTLYVLGDVAGEFSAGQDLESYAAYAEAYFNLTDQTRLTLGGRYTYEKKEFYIVTLDTFQPAPWPVLFECPDASLTDPALAACRDPEESWKKFTPRITLDHSFSDDLMVYASWARGYRSGGWNGRAQSTTSIGPYDPETVDNYEIGLRSELFNNLARLNLTAFHADYKNKQEEVITPSPLNPLATETTVRNASSARIRGVEMELQVIPTERLRLRSAVGYLDAKYKSFIEQGVDVSAERNLRYAPEWTISVGGDYIIPVTATGGDIIIGANYKWTDDFTTSPVKDTSGLDRDVIQSYGTFDASISYEGPITSNGASFRLSAFVNNAFHDSGRLFRTLNGGPFWFGDQEPGRTWGLELQLRY